MRGGGRHCRRQNPADLRQSLQQTSLFSPAFGYSRPNSMGHRPIPHLQRCTRTFLGGCRQRQRFPSSVGHLWRPRKRPPIRLRTLGCCSLMLQHQQSSVLKELPTYVVSRDSAVLSQHSCFACRVSCLSLVRLQSCTNGPHKCNAKCAMEQRTV